MPLVETYERRTLDLRMQTFADPRRADPGVVAVVIDQKSLDAVAAPRARGGLEQGWPWPRDFYAAVLDYLLAAGARAIAFDVVFSERSIYTQLGVADDDAALARATAGRPVVHAAVLTRERSGDPTTADRAWPEALQSAPRRPRGRAAGVSNKATLPIPPVARAAAGLGWIGFEPDADGTCRSIRPGALYAPRGSAEAVELPSLALALAAAAGVRVERDPLRVAGRPVPLDEDGRLLLRFHGAEGTYREFSFVRVLDAARRHAAGHPLDAARPDEVRGRLVIVGATAAGLLDFRATSAGAILPGYLIHATALDNLLNDGALRRPPARLRTVWLLALGAAAGLLLGLAPTLRGGALGTTALAAVWLGVAVWAFDARGLWLDLVPPALALALALGGSTAHGYLTEGRARRFLRDAFSRYLAPEVVAALVAEPGRLALGGETREVTVMFADLAGFTTLAEGRSPQEVVALMNECFTELTDVIQRHGGTVDKFIGDAVMAFWNAPTHQPDHARRAARAARELLDTVTRLNAAWAARGLPRLAMRVGVATGPAVVGNVGSRTKFNYTVMGDTVNLASRLEGAAKAYDTSSLVAGATVSAAGAPALFRELDLLAVTGRSEPVAVFEALGPDPGPRAEAHRLFATGLAAYRAGRFAAAAGHFEAALGRDPEDGPSRALLARCREFLAHPPPADWRGVHVLTSK
ncbi:MAG: adenylate/guanylate cyclase domain-containing protein [Candidatus Rokubacteria bacterium]|nr:adenylate/guanylate cyclase domain-containing protein [Candidatus Rokubacteria bacterium]